jgi:hypothetical protein
MISFKGFGFMFGGFLEVNLGAGSFAASTVSSASLIYSRSSQLAVGGVSSEHCASCRWKVVTSVGGDRARFFFDEELNFFSQEGASMFKAEHENPFSGICRPTEPRVFEPESFF